MWDLLPGDNVISGWHILAGADRKAASEAGLYDMYDGAVPQMREAGMYAAAQRIYKKGNKRFTVDLLKFSTWQQAKAYYVARRDEISATAGFGKTNSVKQELSRTTAAGTTVGYFWNKRYMCSLSVNGTSDAEKQAVTSVATYISQKITLAR